MAQFQEFEKSVRWFRGISMQQTAACDNLLHALRDDFEQGTTYRVQECMLILGITPIINSKQIKTIMHMSRANDLCFLWFVWQAHYKTTEDCESQNYSLNEQLLLSAIAHLDMHSTMRELDRILPPPAKSKKFQEQQRLREQRQAEEQLQRKRTCALRSVAEYASPYFAPQNRPKMFVPSVACSKPKDREIQFPLYDKYKDDANVYDTETRARAGFPHEFSPIKREIKRCLSQALVQLFEQQAGGSVSKICDTHRLVEQAANLKQSELMSRMYQRYLTLIDVEGVQKSRRRERILRQLEREVDQAAQRLQQYTANQLAWVQQYASENKGNSLCQICDKLCSMPKVVPDAGQALLMDPNCDKLAQPLLDERESDNEPVKVLEIASELRCKFVTTVDAHVKWGAPKVCRVKATAKAKRATLKSKPVEIRVLDKDEQILRVLPSDYVPPCPAASSDDETFATGNAYQGAFILDYYKVLEPPACLLTAERSMQHSLIRSFCIAAIKQEPDAKLVPPVLGERCEAVDEAVKQCAVSMFRTGADQVPSIELSEDDDQCKLRKKEENEQLLQLESIDPEDTEQLLKLLKVGIETLRGNPHYVLATLPNAHMLPILLDWIAQRYGKTYNSQEMYEFVNSCEQLQREITTHQLGLKPLPVPRMEAPADLPANASSYLRMLALKRQGNKMRADYHRALNEQALEESRLIWLALRGYSNLAASLRDTFFAYMPATLMDIKRHNFWRSTDFRNMAIMRSLLKKNPNN
ncbi:LOW QUALITY PROTEIN: uncharacterized protein LOC108594536 [Drosophila busckii]|uniref:LOW QUALITY PROTEIN: uncharacterized protein LOC108594536 n=1 Tax=Drosophila busckii TaxID=30019 RepID=UPI00143291A5|nr:LOW QUALITY PROTEIN: uncharacterized protein LOC108594536 [Drosophila busckii]